MAGKVIGWAFEEGRKRDLSPTQRYVLVAYGDNASEAEGKCWPDKAEIVEKTGYSQATVYRAIKELVAEGLMVFTEDGKGRPCVFLAVPWASHGEKDDSQSDKADSQSEKGSNKEPSQTVTKLFDFWKKTMQLNGRHQLTKERRAAVERQLKAGYSSREIAEAIVGCSLTPHNMGKNDREELFNDLELICRTGKNVERFRDTARRKGKKKSGETAGEQANRVREERKREREAER